MFFPTHQDPAIILGRIDFHSEFVFVVFVFRIPIPGFPDLQIARFLDSQISGFSDF